MDNKTRPFHMLSTRDPLRIRRHTQTGSLGWRRVCHESANKQTKAGVAILGADERDFKTK